MTMTASILQCSRISIRIAKQHNGIAKKNPAQWPVANLFRQSSYVPTVTQIHALAPLIYFAKKQIPRF